MSDALGEHKIRCRTCGEVFDMRDLGEVFEHEDCEGWESHEATCDDCGSSTHTNGEIVHCDSCDWWEEIGSSDTESDPPGGGE